MNKEGAQPFLEQLTNNGEDVLPCCHDLLFAKNGQGRTLDQEVQANLENETSLYHIQEKLLLMDYLHSFTEHSLAVSESTEEHATTSSAIAIHINPLLNDFQRVLANQMLCMSLTSPDVVSSTVNE